jgi:membrane protein implicated in regulation of membrane protease activity
MELLSNPVLFWVAVAVVCAIVEMVMPSFGWVFGTASALIVAGLSLAGVGLAGQLLVFAVTLVLALVLIRPRLVKSLDAQGVPLRTDLLIGKVGEVSSAIDPVTGQGRVLIGGEDWAARSDHPIASGTRVRVLSVDGIRLLVTDLHERMSA